MKYKWLILIASFCSLLISWDHQDKYEADDLIIATFQDYGNCSKCYIQPELEIYNIENEIPSDVKLVALVKCRRSKELKVFNEMTGWRYDSKMDKKGRIKKQLGLKPDIALVLMRGNGEVIMSFSYKEVKGSGNTMKKYINNL